MIQRREFLQTSCAAAAALAGADAQAASAERAANRRIIDVHLHAYPADFQIPQSANPMSRRQLGLRDGAQHRAACLAEMTRHNVVAGIVSGGAGDRLRAAAEWRSHDPGRIIAGAGIRGSDDTPLPPVETLRAAFASGELQVLGEVSSQYAGRSISDPLYAPYLALAAEFDVPVALHSGMMPPGSTFDPCCRTARSHLGRPTVIEEALNRHPKLRFNLMHLGAPYLEDTLAMMTLYPNVYVDTGAANWLMPRAQFHAYLRQLVEAGFSDRIMFGSDQMFWPDAIGLAIAGIESAAFLSAEAKQAIFYDNAARFYRLSG